MRTDTQSKILYTRQHLQGRGGARRVSAMCRLHHTCGRMGTNASIGVPERVGDRSEIARAPNVSRRGLHVAMARQWSSVSALNSRSNPNIFSVSITGCGSLLDPHAPEIYLRIPGWRASEAVRERGPLADT